MNIVPNTVEKKGLKVLLCTTPLDIGIPRDSGELPVYPKIAIVSLIKWLERHGYERRKDVDFYDIDMMQPSDEQMRAYFEKTKPNVIGLSAVVSTTYLQVQNIARIAREACPDAWIIVGGSLSVAANVVLHKTEVDICVQSDGENPLVEFCNYAQDHQSNKDWDYEALQKIKGLSFLDDKGLLQFTGYPTKIPSSENPFPDYDILKMGLTECPEMFQNYFRKGRGSSWFKPDPRSYEKHRRPIVASLWTTKGCVARCTFCQRSTKGYGVNDPQTLDEHVAYLKDTYNVGFIHIIDENFGSNKSHAKEVAKVMKKHDMLWICSGVRCASMDYDTIKFFKENNCSGLKFGVESGSQKILDIMEKRFTVEQVYTALRNCYSVDLYSPIGIMVGMPGETNETAFQTGRYIGKVARIIGEPPADIGYSIVHALPLPGTPLYQYGQQTGMIGRSVDDEEKYLITVSDQGSTKENYINLNGSPLRDILFWEFLVRYEATRTFYEKPLGEDEVVKHNLNVTMKNAAGDIFGVEHDDANIEIQKLIPSLGSLAHKDTQATIHNNQNAARNARFKTTGLKNFLNPKYVVWWFYQHSTKLITRLNFHLSTKKWVSKLPRFLIYGVMKNLQYAEFMYVKTVRKILRAFGFNIRYRNLFNDFKYPKPITQKEVDSFSMRIEKSLRHKVKLIREDTFKPENITEENQEVLHMGR